LDQWAGVGEEGPIADLAQPGSDQDDRQALDAQQRPGGFREGRAQFGFHRQALRLQVAPLGHQPLPPGHSRVVGLPDAEGLAGQVQPVPGLFSPQPPVAGGLDPGRPFVLAQGQELSRQRRGFQERQTGLTEQVFEGLAPFGEQLLDQGLAWPCQGGLFLAQVLAFPAGLVQVAELLPVEAGAARIALHGQLQEDEGVDVVRFVAVLEEGLAPGCHLIRLDQVDMVAQVLQEVAEGVKEIGRRLANQRDLGGPGLGQEAVDLAAEEVEALSGIEHVERLPQEFPADLPGDRSVLVPVRVEGDDEGPLGSFLTFEETVPSIRDVVQACRLASLDHCTILYLMKRIYIMNPEDKVATQDVLKQILNEVVETIYKRFDRMDQRFDAVDQRFDAVDQRLDRLEQVQAEQTALLEQHRAILQEHTLKLDGLEKKIGLLEERIQLRQERLDVMSETLFSVQKNSNLLQQAWDRFLDRVDGLLEERVNARQEVQALAERQAALERRIVYLEQQWSQWAQAAS